MLSEKAIDAIEAVVTINNDVADKLEARGVLVADMRMVFRLARKGLLAEKLAKEARSYVVAWRRGVATSDFDDLMAAVKAVEEA
jgi:hypothetical protein